MLLDVAEMLSSLIDREQRPIRIEFLTLQDKPNTHAWGVKSPTQHFPFLLGSWIRATPLKYMAPRTTDGAGSCQHVRLPGNKFKRVGKSPLAGPIRYRAYRLPYSRLVASTFKCLTTTTTHCDLSTLFLHGQGPMIPP